MKISLLQVNTVVGDLAGNAGRIAGGVREAARDRPDLIVAPELSLTGCPLRDLLLRPGFVARALSAVDELAANLASAPPLILGLPIANPAGTGCPAFNAAALIREGEVAGIFRKPSISAGVLNEDRYFEPAGGEIPFIRLGGKTVGVVIGETICCEGPMPDVIVNPVASPFAVGRGRLREEYLSGFAREHGVAVASVTLWGETMTWSLTAGVPSSMPGERSLPAVRRLRTKS